MYVFGSGGVGGVGSEWVRRLGLGYTNPGRTWDSRICLCVLVVVECVGFFWGGSGWSDGARVWEGGVVLCMCVL